MLNHDRYKELFNILSQSPPARITTILRHADVETIKSVTEIIYNVLKGVLPLSDKEKRVLSGDKDIVKKIVCVKSNLATKRKYMTSNPRLIKTIIRIYIKNTQ
jgi:hypothetical protein